MTTVADQSPVVNQPLVNKPVVIEPMVNEDVWRAWIQKGQLQERASARKLKLTGGLVLVLLAAAAIFFAGK